MNKSSIKELPETRDGKFIWRLDRQGDHLLFVEEKGQKHYAGMVSPVRNAVAVLRHGGLVATFPSEEEAKEFLKLLVNLGTVTEKRNLQNMAQDGRTAAKIPCSPSPR